jgi:uncharacterized protein (TIGR02118 family)
MIQLDIQYPNTPGSHFELDDDLQTHMPLSRRLFGDSCKGVRIERGVAGIAPGAPADFIVACHMRFESVDAFVDAWMVHGGTPGGDIANHTSVQPVIQFSEAVPFA